MRIDKYWLAGLYEGEGSFGGGTRHTNGSRSPLLRIGMSDLDIIRRVMALMPHGRYYKPKLQPGYQQMHYYHHTGLIGYAWMLALLPMLGQRRRQQILDISAQWNPRSALRTTQEALNETELLTGIEVAYMKSMLKGRVKGG